MPGYEPFLLCDFHVHTKWSDGALGLRDVIDLYGQTRKFDVIAITDHILMKKDILAGLGRVATLGPAGLWRARERVRHVSCRDPDARPSARWRNTACWSCPAPRSRRTA